VLGSYLWNLYRSIALVYHLLIDAIDLVPEYKSIFGLVVDT
jgi:hypothetical protein